MKKYSELSHKEKRTVLLIEVMLIGILVILLFFLRSLYQRNTAEHYTEPEEMPVVTADDGRLTFNEVSVKVPKENAKYLIGYDPASPDEEYPSVPSSASVYYTDDSGNITYEVVLYRDRVMPKSTDHEQYTMKDWFEEWTPATDKGSKQEEYSTDETKGFLIRVPDKNEDGEKEEAKEEAADDAAEGGATIDETDGEETASDSEEREGADAKGTDDAEETAGEKASIKEEGEAAGDDAKAEEASEGETVKKEKTYCSYTYYFAIETEKNIEQYVLELDYYDPDSVDRSEELFNTIAESIHLRKRIA